MVSEFVEEFSQVGRVRQTTGRHTDHAAEKRHIKNSKKIITEDIRQQHIDK